MVVSRNEINVYIKEVLGYEKSCKVAKMRIKYIYSYLNNRSNMQWRIVFH